MATALRFTTADYNLSSISKLEDILYLTIFKTQQGVFENSWNLQWMEEDESEEVLACLPIFQIINTKDGLMF